MFLQRLVEMVAPAACLECGVEGELLCRECLGEANVAAARCYNCNISTNRGATCESCRPVAPLAGVTVAADYAGAVKALVLELKFGRSRSGARVAAQLAAQRLDRGAEWDTVTAVPVAPARYRERGYNQSELIGRALARELGLPYRQLLERRNAQHQLGRSRAERLAQIHGAFYAPRRLDGERVLIVDDVVTTGATLAECARTLVTAGAGEVWGAAVARGR